MIKYIQWSELLFKLWDPLPKSKVCFRTETVLSNNFVTKPLVVLRNVCLLFMKRGQWKKKWIIDSSRPQLHKGLIRSWKLCLNLCSRKILRPSLSLVMNLDYCSCKQNLEMVVWIEKFFFNPLSANPTKWSNTLKQFVWVCLSVFDHFTRLALKGLNVKKLLKVPRAWSRLFHAIIIDEKKEFLKKLCFALRRGIIFIFLLGISFSSYRNDVNPLSVNPTKWSNTLKQFVRCCQRIVGVCLTILWSWRVKV